MPINNTIISYTNVIKPFGNDQNALLAKTHDAAAKVIPDPAKLDATMADFKFGLDLWRESEIHPLVLHTPRHAMVSLLQSHVVKQAGIGHRVESFIVKIADKMLEGFDVRFSASDWPEWALSFFTWVSGIVPAKQLPPTPTADPVENSFSIGVLGDFGTGLYGGPACQDSIQNGTDEYSLMLHLGDVYYSATPEEIEQRFFQYWPNKAKINRTMNGNHEMYNGGHTYFETMLPRFNQSASYFALQNDNWLIAVLDSSYFQAFGGQEGVFDDRQMQWLSNIVKSADNRGLVLFSHHQPFTHLDKNNGGNLISQLEKYNLASRIFAWYWGHEHRCLLYDRHPKYGFFGRCVGHAAFPEDRPDLTNAAGSEEFGSQWRRLEQEDPKPGGNPTVTPAAFIYDTNNLYIHGFETMFAPNGYMRLEFNGKELVEYVRAPDGANVWLKPLPQLP